MFKNLIVLLAVVLMLLAVSVPALAEPGQGRRPDSVPGPPAFIGEQPDQEKPEAITGEKQENAAEKTELRIPGPPVFVEEILKQRLTVIDSDKITVRGRPFQSDLPPVLRSGRILIPVRAVMNALQAVVVWDEANQTITITRDHVVVVIRLGEIVYYVNGEPLKMDVPAQRMGNRTFVPLRFIAEALGEKVGFAKQSGAITIGETPTVQ